jgi:branched-subunit amino acid aminotransferase/4-amino-4-deoxychorismate lyase
VELLETMRAEHGRIALLERHIERLTRAAEAFDYRLDLARVRAGLDTALEGSPAVARVRLTVDRYGGICIGLVTIDRVPPIATVIPLPWTAPPDPALSRFKTTDRLHYEAALENAWAAGADEALLVDEGGRLIEATRANVWIRTGDALLTPPLRQMGLEGVMRSHLLETRPHARQVDLFVEDLNRADEVLLSNAVRGLFPVSLGTRAGAAA